MAKDSTDPMRAVTVPNLCALPLAAMPVSDSATDEVFALTAALRNGDETSFRRFHTLYAARLYSYLLVVARGDEGEAREVAQTVWVKVAARCETCADDRALWAWLTRVARNAFIDQRRARMARERRIVPIDENADVHAELAERDTALRAGLREVLAALPADERELLDAVYVDGQPLGAIAAAAGASYKAIESKVGRLRSRVRALLLKSLRHESR
jgi:RNA polymerase sigma factor (sigma-70 family)